MYDAHTDRAFDIATVDDPGKEIHPELQFLGSQATLLLLKSVPHENPFSSVPSAEYIYRDGVIERIPMGRGRLFAILPDGTQLRQINWMTVSVVPRRDPARMIRF